MQEEASSSEITPLEVACWLIAMFAVVAGGLAYVGLGELDHASGGGFAQKVVPAAPWLMFLVVGMCGVLQAQVRRRAELEQSLWMKNHSLESRLREAVAELASLRGANGSAR